MSGVQLPATSLDLPASISVRPSAEGIVDQSGVSELAKAHNVRMVGVLVRRSGTQTDRTGLAFDSHIAVPRLNFSLHRIPRQTPVLVEQVGGVDVVLNSLLAMNVLDVQYLFRGALRRLPQAI